jgi:hypothetical protein
MASIAFVDPTIWVAGLDMTGDLNEVGLNVSVDELDSTTFGTTGYRARKGGLRTVEFTAGGFLDTSTIEPEVFPRLGTADRVVTIAPDGGETNTAYIFRSGLFQADLGGAIGDLAAVKLTSKGTDPQGLVRGQVAKASGTVNSTGVLGSVVNVGAVSASQYVYAAFHVFTAGPHGGHARPAHHHGRHVADPRCWPAHRYALAVQRVRDHRHVHRRRRHRHRQLVAASAPPTTTKPNPPHHPPLGAPHGVIRIH